MSFESYVFRKMCAKSDKKRDKGLKIPADVEYIRNLSYGEHKKYHLLDLCMPKTQEHLGVDSVKKKLPVIVSVHGGGYVYGSKEIYQFYAASLAQKGYAVINHNYRLAPEYRFPAPIEDLVSVLNWLVKNSEQYSFDLNKVFLVGDSAGAQIALQYGAIYSNRDYESIMQVTHPAVKIIGLGLCCGSYDLKKRIETEGLKGVLKDYLTVNPSVFGEKLDVFEALTDKFPPSFLFSSYGDFLLNECQLMAEVLASKGVCCEYKIYGTEQTGHVFHVDMRNEFGTEANSDMISYFNKLIEE